MASIFGKKYRTFDLQSRLHPRTGGIHFDRLPRKKVKPLWWSLAVFIIVLLLYYYLQKF